MRLRMMLLLASAMLIGQAPTAASSGQTPAARLRTYPAQTYFTSANDKERIAGSIFFLILEMPDKAPVTPVSLRLTYREGQATVKVEEFHGSLLEAIDVTGIPPSRLNSVTAGPPVYWPHAFRLFVTLPANVKADRIDAQLTYRSGSRRHLAQATIPVARYVQRTALTFPFKGEGIVSVAGALASGHRNRSGLHAIDALGLTPTYGPMREPGRDAAPADYAGWGREVIAPATGTIVVARNDRPDQPVADKSDPAFFAPEYPDGGDPGNLVIIDHGNGEFSMIGHLRHGSVKVRPGDRVAQGQIIGLMGNSGDTTGPHVHYQLQNGPDWERSDGLPVAFTNVGPLTRGSYFKSK